MIKAFEELMEVSRILNSPDGCPWDLEQTFDSLKPYILEEAHEALEAIEEGSDEEIIEELGDLLYTVVFYAKVAEREGRFTIQDILETLRSKLIRRHPHVFGDAANDLETVKYNWERIKQEEKKRRPGPLDSIPKTLPLLMRAQKVFRRMKQHGVKRAPCASKTGKEELFHRFLDLVAEATDAEIDLESGLRKVLSQHEKDLHTSQA